MAKPSEIRSSLSKYICSCLWVQRWGIQDPLEVQPVISNKTYPSNTATELPIEQLEITKSEYSSNNYTPARILAKAKFPFRIAYVFKRESYQDFRLIPISQLENLLFRCSSLLMIFAEKINDDIITVSIPQQQNPFTIRPASDIYSDDAFANDWVAIAKLDIDIDFITDPAEFTVSDWIDIQPSVFGHPDGLPLENIGYNPFDLNKVKIEVNRSHLPSVNTLDESTFELEEIIEILKPIEE